MQPLLEQRLSVRGDLIITAVDESTGEVVRRQEIRNMLMTSGMSLIGEVLAGYATPATQARKLAWIRVGISTTPPTLTDTLASITDPVGGPVGGAYLPATVTTSVAGSSVTVKCLATLPSGLSVEACNSNDISEAGLISIEPAGYAVVASGTPGLVARQVFSGVPKTSSLSILFDWRITFTA